MKYFTVIILLFTFLALGVMSCGTDEPADTDSNEEAGLTDFEHQHGIGPIDEPMDIPESIDMDKVEQGRQFYRTRCSSCHRMDQRHVGPPLGMVTESRSPEWIMNFTLNPGENIRNHPVGQSLLREYLTEMPQQNVNEDQARAILEYLRYQAEQD